METNLTIKKLLDLADPRLEHTELLCAYMKRHNQLTIPEN